MSQADRDAELVALMPVVERIAAWASRRRPRHADDALSDAMLGALELARSHDPARARLRTHLERHLPLRMVDRLRLRTGRRGRRRVEAGPLGSDPPAPRPGERLDHDDAVEALLRPLTPARREVMRAWASGDTPAEIARRLGVSRTRASQIVWDAVRELREAHGAKESE